MEMYWCIFVKVLRKFLWVQKFKTFFMAGDAIQPIVIILLLQRLLAERENDIRICV